MTRPKKESKKAAIIVAHPDDETLWAGGFVLMHPEYEWHILSLCRGDDPDRAPRFKEALKALRAVGQMDSLDDSPEKQPLEPEKIKKAVLRLLPPLEYQLILTHHPEGEYTKNLRHEEIARAVIDLWRNKKLISEELRLFAYEDGKAAYLPRPAASADCTLRLPEKIWDEKYKIITQIYGFSHESFEAKTTPRNEAFLCFKDPEQKRLEVFKEK